ncbi:MAG: hypothetical protein R2759_13775 [Bacteroidales bacterium]
MVFAGNFSFIAGSQPDKGEGGSACQTAAGRDHTEIHTLLPADFKMMKPDAAQLKPTTKPIGHMIGADISFSCHRSKTAAPSSPRTAIPLML